MRLLPPARRRAVVAAAALMLGGCREAAAPAGATPGVLVEADVVTLDSLTAGMTASMAAPAVVSLLGVTVPFAERVARPWPGPARALVLPAARGLPFLGDLPIDPGYAGQTFVRAGAVFRRDTTRRDAPAGQVRVLLYERLNGAFTPSVIGWLDLADSVRTSGLRVTRASLGTPAQPAVATVRGSLAIASDPVLGNRLHDVLLATVGTGAAQLRLFDSLVVDDLSGAGGRGVTVVEFPSRGATVVGTTPASPGGSPSTSRVLITLGRRSVRLEVIRTLTGQSVGAFLDGTLVGSAPASALPNLGDAARAPTGGPLDDRSRRWLNAVGLLIASLPAAADFAQAAGDYVSLLDPIVAP